MSIPGVSPGGSFPRDASRRQRSSFVLASDFQRTFASVSPLFVPSSVPKAGAKVLPFSHSASTFFNYFFTFSHHADCQRENFSVRGFFGGNLHLNILMKGSPMAKTRGPERAKKGASMVGRGVFRPLGGGLVVPTWAGFGCLGRTTLACAWAGICGGGGIQQPCLASIGLCSGGHLWLRHIIVIHRNMKTRHYISG